MLEQFYEFIDRGGPVMWPLSISGLAIIFLGILQTLKLLSINVSFLNFFCSETLYWKGKAIGIIRRKSGLTGLTLIESIELFISRMQISLTGWMNSLRFLAQTSTLLGFLGTVTGMVKVFNTVAQKGTATPADLASGIYEALFTTVYGLVLALIAWGFCYVIEVLSDNYLHRTEIEIISELEKHEPEA
ncbi:MAG: MotA/TolQ/ExbB proton channel family protein [Candidatus Riflebacteria bacterium]|nr:MotA/TolQ/ExbB proton channel family protein [Candidatus Riflebacteria bacterium]